MKNARARKLGVLVLALGVLSGFGVIARAAVPTGSHHSRLAARLSQVAPGPDRLARAEGLGTAMATPVFAQRGVSASVVTGHSSRCLVRRTHHGRGETCGTFAEVDDGQTISVNDECGSSGANRMTISGLTPEGTEKVLILYSDDHHEVTDAEGGAFLFEGTNPGPDEPYPTGVRWRGSGGTSLGEAELPVNGDQFCIEPPEPPAAP